MVGASAAYTIAIQETVSEIVLIDVATELAAGQAMDISHATGYSAGVRVRTGDYSEIKRDDIVVITSGVPRRPDQTRLELTGINARIMRDVVGKVMAQGQPVFIVVVTNPVDILTHVALVASGLPRSRVFGTGTTLDTARLRITLAQHLQVSPAEIQAYILGEHGDSSFAALSGASIGGLPLAKFPGYKPQMAAGLSHEIRTASQKIIESKKVTYFGIGQVVAKLVAALTHPDGGIFPVCMLTKGEYGLRDVVLGLPALVNASGAQLLDDYPLNAAEIKQLRESAAVLKDVAETHMASPQNV